MQTVNTHQHQPTSKVFTERVAVDIPKTVWTDEDVYELQIGMIKSAINDVRDGRKSKLMQREAKRWLLEDDYVHPLSFCNCCRSVGLDAELLRSMLSRLLKGGFENESI